MKQTTLKDFGLDWLSNEWTPQKVTIFRGRVEDEESNERFDEQLAIAYGYNSVKHMNKYNHKKDMETYLKYGDRTKGLI